MNYHQNMSDLRSRKVFTSDQPVLRPILREPRVFNYTVTGKTQLLRIKLMWTCLRVVGLSKN